MPVSSGSLSLDLHSGSVVAFVDYGPRSSSCDESWQGRCWRHLYSSVGTYACLLKTEGRLGLASDCSCEIQGHSRGSVLIQLSLSGVHLTEPPKLVLAFGAPRSS